MENEEEAKRLRREWKMTQRRKHNVVTAVACIGVMVAFLTFITFHRPVYSDCVGIKETSEGLSSEILWPGIYFRNPYTTSIHIIQYWKAYYRTILPITYSNAKTGQVNITMVYNIDTDRVFELYDTYRDSFENEIFKPLLEKMLVEASKKEPVFKFSTTEVHEKFVLACAEELDDALEPFGVELEDVFVVKWK